MFYTNDYGHRWSMMAVDHPTLERALASAARSSFDCSETRVYDCTGSPNGKLVAVYTNGQPNAARLASLASLKETA